jgi:hypothetical protein
MLTLKEKLIEDIRYLPNDKTIKTKEVLDSGHVNEMTFLCPHSSLMQIIFNLFDENLYGRVPGGIPTKINSWEVIDIPKEENNEE